MLAARRRLLLMLIGLEAAAIALAVLGLAAVWVVIPPSIMLIGYLLLLREAGQADAERARHEAEAAERARARTAHARRATPAEGTPTAGIAEAAAALAAKLAAAPVPADYEDSGRPRLRAWPGRQVHDLERARRTHRGRLLRRLRPAPSPRRRRLGSQASHHHRSCGPALSPRLILAGADPLFSEPADP